MALALFKERRLSTRKKLTGLTPGRVKDAHGKDVLWRPYDISEKGLGIISNHFFKDGDIIQMIVKEQVIKLKVIWQKPDFVKKDLFRYGLITEDNSVDLEKIFSDSGCLI